MLLKKSDSNKLAARAWFDGGDEGTYDEKSVASLSVASDGRSQLH